MSVLRARNQMTEVRLADLRFSTGETATFMQKVLGVPLSDAAVAGAGREDGRLDRQPAPRGVDAALQLGCWQPSSRIGGLERDRYLTDYLMSEVLARTPPAVADFLLKTAILDRMCGPVCDALIGRMTPKWMLNAVWSGWSRTTCSPCPWTRALLVSLPPSLPELPAKPAGARARGPARSRGSTPGQRLVRRTWFAGRCVAPRAAGARSAYRCPPDGRTPPWPDGRGTVAAPRTHAPHVPGRDGGGRRGSDAHGSVDGPLWAASTWPMSWNCSTAPQASSRKCWIRRQHALHLHGEIDTLRITVIIEAAGDPETVIGLGQQALATTPRGVVLRARRPPWLWLAVAYQMVGRLDRAYAAARSKVRPRTGRRGHAWCPHAVSSSGWRRICRRYRRWRTICVLSARPITGVNRWAGHTFC